MAEKEIPRASRLNPGPNLGRLMKNYCGWRYDVENSLQMLICRFGKLRFFGCFRLVSPALMPFSAPCPGGVGPDFYSG
ncbi:hypothetical protein [Geothermobacter ehrlichii]|uniref:hypothetical protein n=1 Tax=Geothermobacter ehrlichii TaxID=213224 RepID=UPI0011E74DF1|nr:hypothetical protein [Geothermobacter ehrlichii]